LKLNGFLSAEAGKLALCKQTHL